MLTDTKGDLYNMIKKWSVRFQATGLHFHYNLIIGTHIFFRLSWITIGRFFWILLDYYSFAGRDCCQDSLHTVTSCMLTQPFQDWKFCSWPLMPSPPQAVPLQFALCRVILESYLKVSAVIECRLYNYGHFEICPCNTVILGIALLPVSFRVQFKILLWIESACSVQSEREN